MNRLFIYYASTLHIVWAIGLIFSPVRVYTTALSSIYTIFPFPHQWNITPTALIISSTLALLGILYPFREPIFNGNQFIIKVMLILPQFFLILVSAMGAMQATSAGHFADGVMRPQMFIFLDQVYPIMFAAFYMIVIVEPLYKRGRFSWNG